MQTKKTVSDTAAVADPPKELVDRLAGLLPEEELCDALEGLSPEQITGPGGLVTQLAGRVIETALEAEMTADRARPREHQDPARPRRCV